MKSVSALIASLVVLVAPLFAHADTAPASTERVRVTWTDPAHFAETRTTPAGLGEKTEDWLPELAKTIQRRAAPLLADGQRLDVEITDVKRAGNFEPNVRPNGDRIRIVREMYPPRIELNFRLLGSNGEAVREGKATLRDPAFMQRTPMDSNDPLRYEKRLLQDWLRRELK